MKYIDIQKLVKLVEASNIAELEIVEGDGKLRITKLPPASPLPNTTQFIPVPTGFPPNAAVPPPISSPPSAVVSSKMENELTAPVSTKKLIEIQSPMVGTFYRAPSPEAPPYVQVGDRVRPGQVLCIIEAMKLMNELESEYSGTIVEILVENAQPVEFGQILFRIDPS